MSPCFLYLYTASQARSCENAFPYNNVGDEVVLSCLVCIRARTLVAGGAPSSVLCVGSPGRGDGAGGQQCAVRVVTERLLLCV
eukprot:scaffold14068_cov119-Isochrysis_galbana.AAC.4